MTDKKRSKPKKAASAKASDTAPIYEPPQVRQLWRRIEIELSGTADGEQAQAIERLMRELEKRIESHEKAIARRKDVKRLHSLHHLTGQLPERLTHGDPVAFQIGTRIQYLGLLAEQVEPGSLDAEV